MSVLKKIMTAIRGGAREVGELVVDANGTRIFEQEINDAQTHLRKAKQDLTEVMAKQMQASRKAEATKASISEHEGYAAQALDKDDEALALEIAEKIAQLDVELTDETEYERQLSMVKTTESVQKASAAITDNFSSSNSRILSAKDSLERIKKRQQDNFDKMSAAEALMEEDSDKGLEDRMKAAGIGEQKTSANSVLDRIKANKSA